MKEVERKRRLQVDQNWIDRAIAYVNPEAGQRRLRARAQLAISGSFVGAARDRKSTKEWNHTRGTDADTDLMFDLDMLRDRSLDQSRNNPLATGAVNTVVTNVVGTGMSLQSQIDGETLGLSPEEAADLQATIEREFRLWAEYPHCDATNTLNFYQLQELAFRSALVCGDVGAALPMRPSRTCPYQLKVQLIEGHRISNPRFGADNAAIVDGVELDEFGAAVAYHIANKHPRSINTKPTEWKRIPAYGTKSGRRNFIHLFDRLRPGQTRGIPYLAPVLDALHQLGEYSDAELTAAVVSGLLTVFVETEGAVGLDTGDGTDGYSPNDSARGGDEVKLGKGAMVDLRPGEKISTVNPGRPNEAFDPFVMAWLRQIGVALELPFELLVKHFQSSYSAARAALLEAQRFFKKKRSWLAAMFCQPIYEAWLEEAVAIGRIQAPGFFDDPAIRAAYCRAEWIGDSFGQIDPEKEVGAAEKRMEVGVSTLFEETPIITGRDYETVHKNRVRQKEMLERDGLPMPGAATNAASSPAPAPAGKPAQPPNDGEDNTDPQDGTSDTGNDNNGDMPQ